MKLEPMTPEKVIQGLNRVEKDLKRLIADSASYILPEVISNVRESYKLYKSKKAPTWGYVISPRRPLTFKQSERPTQANRVDIYCEIHWKDETVPVQQDIKIRVWGLHEKLFYRDGIDGTLLKAAFDDPFRRPKGRVISRYHFDRVNLSKGTKQSQEYHPTYHLQIGGTPEDDEFCWHPKSFDIPRIPHHPMDFFLTCQLVVMNFFPDAYINIKKSAEWKHLISTTQKNLLTDYYTKCVQWIDSGESLLEKLADL